MGEEVTYPECAAATCSAALDRVRVTDEVTAPSQRVALELRTRVMLCYQQCVVMIAGSGWLEDCRCARTSEVPGSVDRKMRRIRVADKLHYLSC